MSALPLSTVTAGLREAGLVEDVLAQHQILQESRENALAWARRGITAMITAGQRLIEAQKALSGDFDDWLKAWTSSLPEEIRFSYRTAYNYMRAVRYLDELESPDPKFASVQELFIAAGIMPQKPEANGSAARPAPLYTLNLRVNAPPPEKWSSMDRREFLQKAQPVVELYERVKAAEEGNES